MDKYKYSYLDEKGINSDLKYFVKVNNENVATIDLSSSIEDIENIINVSKAILNA